MPDPIAPLPHPDLSHLPAVPPKWKAVGSDDSRTLEGYDAIPKAVYSTTRVVKESEGIASFSILGGVFECEIHAARIKRNGETVSVGTGPREELVERAVRYIACRKWMEDPNGGVSVRISIGEIRTRLRALEHEFKTEEIREALLILSLTVVVLWRRDRDRITGVPTLLLAVSFDNKAVDDGGRSSFVTVQMHYWFTSALRNHGFWPMNDTRIGKLKSPFARWMTERLSHKFRQADVFGRITKNGYNISLNTILAEGGLVNQRLHTRKLIKVIRQGFAEMQEAKILADGSIEGLPLNERLIYGEAIGVGRKAVVNVVWTLFPSAEMAREIISGNVAMNGLSSGWEVGATPE